MFVVSEKEVALLLHGHAGLFGSVDSLQLALVSLPILIVEELQQRVPAEELDETVEESLPDTVAFHVGNRLTHDALHDGVSLAVPFRRCEVGAQA